MGDNLILRECWREKVVSVFYLGTQTPIFGGIFEVFCPYLCIQSLKVPEISHTLQAQHYLTPSENCMSRKNLVLAVQ